MRYCRRRIDRTLKKIDLSDAADVAALAADYSAKTGSLLDDLRTQPAPMNITDEILRRAAMATPRRRHTMPYFI
jgi:hypothetical protein